MRDWADGPRRLHAEQESSQLEAPDQSLIQGQGQALDGWLWTAPLGFAGTVAARLATIGAGGAPEDQR